MMKRSIGGQVLGSIGVMKSIRHGTYLDVERHQGSVVSCELKRTGCEQGIP